MYIDETSIFIQRHEEKSPRSKRSYPQLFRTVFIISVNVMNCSISGILEPVNELDMIFGKDLVKVYVADTYHDLLHAMRVLLGNFDGWWQPGTTYHGQATTMLMQMLSGQNFWKSMAWF